MTDGGVDEPFEPVAPTGRALPLEGGAPTETKAPEYVLTFQVKRTEADIEAAFLTKGGSLGSAAARAETDFALTHSDRAVSKLVTETMERVELPISQKLLEMVPEEARRLVAESAAAQAGPVLVLPARARLNVTASRLAASINGTLVGTLSGQGSVPLQDLFSDVLPLSKLIDQGRVEPEDVARLSAALNKDPKAEGAMIKRTDLAKLVDQMPVAIKARVGVPFEMVPLKYSNWGAHQAVLGVLNPEVRRKGCDGESEPCAMSVLWYEDEAETKRLAKVEPILQGVYNYAWALTEKVVFQVKNLTKSVMRVPVGYNASGYALAAAVNDTPPSYPAETMEAILDACLRVELSADEHADLLQQLSVPSVAATITYAPVMASAMSAFSAYSMPYRVDGAPVITPTGVNMVQSESWRAEAIRSILHSDDCDGSACSAVSIVKFAESLGGDAAYPNLRALANSLGAHYVYGTTVLAANAGHADAADEHAQQLAGHAIAMALPKTSFAAALHRGAEAYVGDAPLVKPELRARASKARFDALYPAELIAKIPEKERGAFESFETMSIHALSDPIVGMQPLSMEGTTLASSRMYTHNAQEREQRKQWYALDKQVATSLSPNITRTHKTLDVGEKGEHAFYMAKVEIGVSMEHPLFTSKALRELELASAQYRFAQPAHQGKLTLAGASPKDLSTGAYALLPLWEAGAETAAVLDAAHAESAANTMPMRGEPLQLTDEHMDQLMSSLQSVIKLSAHLREPKPDLARHPTRHVLSFASLLSNPKAIESFVETVIDKGGVMGTVHGIDRVIPGVAVNTGTKHDYTEVGRMVVLNLLVPVEG